MANFTCTVLIDNQYFTRNRLNDLHVHLFVADVVAFEDDVYHGIDHDVII